MHKQRGRSRGYVEDIHILLPGGISGVVAQDHEILLEIDKCHCKEGLTSFWGELVFLIFSRNL